MSLPPAGSYSSLNIIHLHSCTQQPTNGSSINKHGHERGRDFVFPEHNSDKDSKFKCEELVDGVETVYVSPSSRKVYLGILEIVNIR